MEITNGSNIVNGKELIGSSVNGIVCQLSQLGMTDTRKRSENLCMTRLGLKQCPICKNKLHSSVLLLEHLKVKHQKTKVFKCNVCTKKNIRGAMAFVNHVDLCHDSCNVTAEDSKTLPFVKAANRKSYPVACNQIQLLVCERHGQVFPTNDMADKHRINHGNATNPCFMLLVQGIEGSSEEISLPAINEDYNKIRLFGYKSLDSEEYKKLRLEYSFPEDASSSEASQTAVTQESSGYQTEWNRSTVKENWDANTNKTNIWAGSPPELSEKNDMYASYVSPRSVAPPASYSQHQPSNQNRYNTSQPNGL